MPESDAIPFLEVPVSPDPVRQTSVGPPQNRPRAAHGVRGAANGVRVAAQVVGGAAAPDRPRLRCPPRRPFEEGMFAVAASVRHSQAGPATRDARAFPELQLVCRCPGAWREAVGDGEAPALPEPPPPLASLAGGHAFKAAWTHSAAVHQERPHVPRPCRPQAVRCLRAVSDLLRGRYDEPLRRAAEGARACETECVPGSVRTGDATRAALRARRLPHRFIAGAGQVREAARGVHKARLRAPRPGRSAKPHSVVAFVPARPRG